MHSLVVNIDMPCAKGAAAHSMFGSDVMCRAKKTSTANLAKTFNTDDFQPSGFKGISKGSLIGSDEASHLQERPCSEKELDPKPWMDFLCASSGTGPAPLFGKAFTSHQPIQLTDGFPLARPAQINRPAQDGTCFANETVTPDFEILSKGRSWAAVAGCS